MSLRPDSRLRDVVSESAAGARTAGIEIATNPDSSRQAGHSGAARALLVPPRYGASLELPLQLETVEQAAGLVQAADPQR